MSTLPIQAVALADDGTPSYPVWSFETNKVLYIQTPVLPSPNHAWTVAEGEAAGRPHVDLDEERLTQLLTLVPNLSVVTDDQAPEVLSSYLRECKCDAHRLANWTDARFDSPVNVVRTRRIQQAREIAHRWLTAGVATMGGGVG